MMMQLDPPMPVYVMGKGTGIAHAIIDYSIEDHLYWIVFMDKSGECWTVANPEIRAQRNITIGRTFRENENDRQQESQGRPPAGNCTG